jgi:hypothetical protein
VGGDCTGFGCTLVSPGIGGEKAIAVEVSLLIIQPERGGLLLDGRRRA